jgi:hypothetical protein
MKRIEKIKLLKDISAGRKTIAEILPPEISIWVQDETNPDLFHFEGLTKRKAELEKSPGYITLNIVTPINTSH